MANSKEYDALEQEYRRLARKADSRLRALEAYQHDKNYKPAIKWAYAKAQKDIDKWGGNKRFNTAPPKSKVALQAKINDIKNFIDSPSSTKRGITQIYKQRAETLNKNYGTNYTWQEMATFFESEAFDKASKDYGSKTIQRAVAVIQANPKSIKKTIDNANGRVVRFTEDKLVDQAINDLVEKYGINVKDL